MRLVILGAEGFVGATLQQKLREQERVTEVLCVSRDFFENNGLRTDRDTDRIFEAVKKISRNFSVPTTCVNLLSASNVDYCEKNPAVSEFINYKFPRDLFSRLAVCNEVRVISFSSNAVYGGDSAPYDESSPFNPCNVYGEHKAKLDSFLREKLPGTTIFRPTTLFGYPPAGSRSNPVYDLVCKSESNEQVRLVDDLSVNFGFVDDLTEALYEIIVQGEYGGEYNFGGPQSFSRYELGKVIYGYFGKSLDLIERCSLADFPDMAPRPRDTSFSCVAFDKRFTFPRTSVVDFLEDM